MPVAFQPKRPRAKRRKMPKHPLEMRAYPYPMDVAPAQSKVLFGALERCWEIRNLLAADRQEDRRVNRVLREAGQPVHYLTYPEQYVRVSALLKSDLKYAVLHSQVAQDVADRIDEGTKRWLESLKEISAAETSRKRQPSVSVQALKTRGGEPTRIAKSARISGQPLLLAEALGVVSGGLAPLIGNTVLQDGEDVTPQAGFILYMC